MIFNQEEYISVKSRSQKSAAIVTHWTGISGIDPSKEGLLKVGQVIAYFRHTIELVKDPSCRQEWISVHHIMARVKWYMDYPQRANMHPPIILYAATLDSDSSAYFIPVPRFAVRISIIKKTMFKFDYGEDHIAVAIPLLKSE